jgi:hypothetical protein
MGVCFADETAQIPQRYALVLENSTYAFNPLLNPRNDAELMSKTLQQLGFKVKVEHNLNREQLFASTRSFSESLPSGAIALVFYAGHGIQVSNTNYLVPVDMRPTGEQSVPLKAFPLQSLIDHLHAAPSAVNIVILDACRNNPFRPASSKSYRDFSNLGLAKVTLPKGTVIAYSTAPGQLAEDGKGRKNSLYSEILTQQLQQKGLTIEEMLKNVAAIVRKQTLDDQQPWFETSLVDEFYFLPPPGITLLTKAKSVADGANSTDKQSREIDPSTWYLSLKAGDWAAIEDQLQNRIKNLTEDEIPLLKHRADQGNVISMTTLGLAYRDGFLQGRDNKGRSIKSGASNPSSIHWLQQAAEAGFPIAQRELGEMILQGIGTDADEEVGMRWLERASQSSYPWARINYAQRKAGIDPSAELTADGRLKTLQILLEQAEALRNDSKIVE